MARLRNACLAAVTALLLSGCDLATIGFPGVGLERPAAVERPTRTATPTRQPADRQVACPIGTPRSYSDTYGAPRSGGRTHLGVDMLAPTGTPIYAYEDGVVSRLSENALGGTTLFLRGDSGDEYYYAHLSGYADGLTAGQRVTVGQHIAFTGDTGNAAGTPHLHFELRPGGGVNVNPFPYAQRACG
jgi:murein DD-endopeptidase MepM/ murein hydrolase activator NlpD